MFELEQPTSAETEDVQYQRIKQVLSEIRSKSTLQPAIVKELVQIYMLYLLERGSNESAKEYMTLDREINGPQSVQALMKPLVDKDIQVSKVTVNPNGSQAPPSTEPTTQQAQVPYGKQYQQPPERPISSNGSV
ncbi:hypothetical protein I7I51_01324 [Histoplasma capsulatum]|uniref:Uncharacterized protein n=2 Tax=Histoplasma TaxID=5036 RepID=A0A8A1ME96_AJECA|nr:hypothetical protein I7I51_01324 [Histoplasma capsulatum]